MTNKEIKREVGKVLNSRGTLFEKELRIERDIFGRLRLTAVDTPESMMIQGFLFFLMFALAILYGLIYIPINILFSKPDRVSFWTYFFWFLCFGVMIFGFFQEVSQQDFSVSAFYTENGVWGTVIIAAILLVNILAIISRIGRTINSNS